MMSMLLNQLLDQHLCRAKGQLLGFIGQGSGQNPAAAVEVSKQQVQSHFPFVYFFALYSLLNMLLLLG